MDWTLRELTRRLVKAMHLTVAEAELPAHTEQRARCRGCSLIDICLPKETEQLIHDHTLSD